jgi:hypothetical protein
MEITTKGQKLAAEQWLSWRKEGKSTSEIAGVCLTSLPAWLGLLPESSGLRVTWILSIEKPSLQLQQNWIRLQMQGHIFWVFSGV